MSSTFAHDKITPYENSLHDKKVQVAQMFDTISHRYDLLNRVLSFSIDKTWRKKAIKKLSNPEPQTILDVACGTGDMSIMAAKTISIKKIFGIDISEQMLIIGKQKIASENLGDKIEFTKADGENIPFGENFFDGIMVAFGVRNFENFEKGLKEMYRVLKPEKKLIILEFSTPKKKLIKLLYNFYMSKVSPFIAKILRQDSNAYKYLNRSANSFPHREQVTEVMTKAGFRQSKYQSLSFGICCIYEAVK